MFAVTVTLQIKPGDIDAFLPLMIANARTSLVSEEGCHQFDVCREGNTVFLYELYENRVAFDLHLQSAHFKTFDAAVADLVADKQVALFAEVLR